ncbi:hypothetical protein EV421DRAFT_1929417 [Armillaria borealis]|uniref:Uncharacterized protein n=1 Tax=Armillaria borealis TaxID=47425 RepID=A0AA39MU79_9AGAR|nr:hypothetical protein EV421DRAFT_1929417 [Armillaria borealis]
MPPGLADLKKPDIDTITHIFYCGYTFSPDPIKETENNDTTAEKAMEALNKLAQHPLWLYLQGPRRASRWWNGSPARDGKSWSWHEVRPDVVLGFVPNNNAALGKGSRVQKWTLFSNTFLSMRMMIWGSLKPSKTHGTRAFNVVADQVKPMGDGRVFWPRASSPGLWGHLWIT